MKENGKWVTINGSHVFIKEGQTTEDAIAQLQKRKKPEKYYRATGGWMAHGKRIISDEDADVLQRYIDNDYDLEEIDIKKQLDYVNNLDLNQSIRQLHADLNREYKTQPDEIRAFMNRLLDERIAEHQMNLADEFLSNVPKHNDGMLEESVIGVNCDNYIKSKSATPRSSEYAAYTHNCQRCAQTFILRWCYGYDVTAKPADRVWDENKNCYVDGSADAELTSYANKNGYNLHKYGTEGNYAHTDLVIFNEQDVMENLTDAEGMAIDLGGEYYGTRHQLRWINKTVKESGPGSAYICTVCWKGTKSKKKGYSAHAFCIINDGGKIKFIDPQTGNDCSEYFTDNQIVPRKTEIVRVDNCRLNGTVMKEVVNYEGSN